MKQETNARKWTSEEDEFIKSSYNKWYTAAIAEELNRSESSIRKRAWTLGLLDKRGAFSDLTPEKIAYIEEYYATKTTKEISEFINVTESRISRFAISRGLKKAFHIEWTEKQEQFLRENLSLSYPMLEKHLNKSKINIQQKITELKLTKLSRSQWSKIEQEFLIENYGKMDINQLAENVHKGKQNLQEKVFELGLAQKNNRWKWEKWEEQMLLDSTNKYLTSDLVNKTNRSAEAIYSKRKDLGLVANRSTIGQWHETIQRLSDEGMAINQLAKEIGYSIKIVESYCLDNEIWINEHPSGKGSYSKSVEYGLYQKVDIKKENLTLCEWYAYWFTTFKDQKINERTKQKYRADFVSLYERGLGKMVISKITRGEIQAYINVYGATRRKQTVLDHMQKIRSTFRDALFEGVITNNPAGNINPVYIEQTLSISEQKQLRDIKKHLEKAEYQKLKYFILFNLQNLLRKEPEYFSSRNDYPVQIIQTVIFVALKTGARFAEILGITESDVDVERGVITIEKTWNYIHKGFLPTKNTASIRQISIDEELISIMSLYFEWLKNYDIKNDEGAVFILEGYRIFNDTVNAQLKRMLVGLNIEPLSFHKLRHTQISILVGSGVPIEVVAKRVGHTDTGMIRKVYGHLLKDTEEHGNRMILQII